ncbi:MAG: Na+/H+ antiporter NhaA [Alphaproteobacteria bacterium]|nr:Na+/H+ antiporter NhaA [Alphaproteobacteria bacterium]
MATSSTRTPWWAKDATPGWLLLGATVLSFVLQNGPTAAAFGAVLKQHLDLTIGGVTLYETTGAKFVKDALMAVFFLFVGLELKRECVEGPFRNPREAALPALGAIGGMAAPALIYLAVTGALHPDASPAYAHGWAIPTATDIAFAVGVISLLGPRTPPGLRLFLLALAIADDLGAILVIAIFYSSDVAVLPLAVSGAIFLALMSMNWLGVRRLAPYWVLGLALWAAMTKTGVSPTLAGVLTAIAIPMRRPDGRSPLIAAEHALKPWVQLGIMPLFALVVGGVSLVGVGIAELTHPVSVGIAAGLALGKPLGILALTYAGAALLKRAMPGPFLQMLGVTMIAGIGFTMSLFVGALAFADPALAAPVRFGVLGGSALSAIGGLAVLALATRGPPGPQTSSEFAEVEDAAERGGVIEPR